jgi:hypothetical protein
VIPVALEWWATAATTPPAPPGDSSWLAWALSVVCGALAGVCGLAWRTARAETTAVRADAAAALAAERSNTEEARREAAAARAELKEANAQQLALAKTMMSEVVPAMTRTTDVTARATEALLDRGRRG